MKLRQNKNYVTLYTLAIFVVVLFFYSYATASVITYPTEGWQISTPEEQGIRSQMLVEMMEHVNKNSFSIDSILIVRNGYVVLDAYFYPYKSGPKLYAQELENVGSNIKVISNKEITLKCGTKAYRTDITWLWDNSVPITTFLVSVYKDGKCIFLCAHPWKYHDKAEPIVQSLSFN